MSHARRAAWSRAVGVLLTAAALACVSGAGASAEPVAVRIPEGPAYGTVALAAAEGGAPLARGELSQTVSKGRVASRLTFWFADGSLYDETVTFTQNRVFQVIAYKYVQRGPSFPEAMQVSFEREPDKEHARYTVVTRAPNEPEERHEGSVEMPADVYNGMGSLLARNLGGGTARAQMLVFTPKPRLLRMELIPEGTDPYWVGATARQATRYLMKLTVPGLLGVAAKVVGKDPPDVRYWITRAPPAFLRFEGAMFLDGPAWRIEPAPPRWARP